eukprot:2292339-Prymnesium_polylepis.2
MVDERHKRDRQVVPHWHEARAIPANAVPHLVKSRAHAARHEEERPHRGDLRQSRAAQADLGALGNRPDGDQPDTVLASPWPH